MTITRREAAIISAYTGFLLGNFADMQEYAEEVLERPIWTHEFGSKEVSEALQSAARPDFLELDVEPYDTAVPLASTKSATGAVQP